MIKEAAASFPANLSGFQNWIPFWYAQPTTTDTSDATTSASEQEIHQLLLQYPESMQAIAELMGFT
ncbi:MAG: hypothetical protein FWK01_17180 [Pantanalinema sp. GBBB05]|nr:hypothetical protein [Pantanalinema sp. GBBB05]